MFQLGLESRWMGEERSYDRSVIGGLALSAILVFIGILASGEGLYFIDPASLLIVVGGTLGATLVTFSVGDLQAAVVALKEALRVRAQRPQDRIQHLVRLAQNVRKSGILTLESEAHGSEDSFLKKALELTVDAQQEEDLRRILETEAKSLAEQEYRSVQVLEHMGNSSPAMGLIGTLIGLIQMLNSLNNPESIGPAMAVALLTTFYGIFLSNLIFLPIAGKMRNRCEEDLVVRALTVEGVVSMSRQENPIVLEQRLQSYVPLAPWKLATS